MKAEEARLDDGLLAISSLTRALVHEGSFWREVRVVAEAPSTNALVAAESGGETEHSNR